jgi:golgin subfamily A protein 1
VSRTDLLEKENSIILSELKEARKSNQELTNRNEELKRSNVDNEERNRKLLNKMDELKEKSRQLTNQNEMLSESNKQMLEKEVFWSDKHREMEKELEQTMRTKEDLEERVQKIDTREDQVIDSKHESEERISQLEAKMSQLQETIAEKNKTIRLQNQRISDIKKSVQKGDLCMRDETSGHEHESVDSGFASSDQLAKPEQRKAAVKLDPTLSKADKPESYGLDINFQYLHNVIFKFITTYDHEAQKHLVKAISTLLQFSEEEEHLVKQSLESRNSWFRLGDNFKF